MTDDISPTFYRANCHRSCVFLQGQRNLVYKKCVGLISNPTSIARDLCSNPDALRDTGVKVYDVLRGA